jgi:hypothetical protein
MFTSVREWVQGICAIAVLAVLFWAVKHSSMAPLADRPGDYGEPAARAPQGAASPESWSAPIDNGPATTIDDSQVWSMPACVDLGRSLRRLAGARKDLLRAAADDDPRGPAAAREQYQLAIAEVQGGFAKLRTLTDPDRYQEVSESLMARYLPVDGEYVRSWELGSSPDNGQVTP